MTTPKQEKFCQAVVRGMNQSDAYRQAYDAKRMSSKTVNQKACRLMAKGNIGARVQELRAPVVKAVQMDQATWLRHIERRATFDPRLLFDAEDHPIPIHKLSDVAAAGIIGFEYVEQIEGHGDSRRVVGSLYKYKLTDPLRGLELFGKATGYYVERFAVPPMSALESAATDMLLAMRDRLRQELETPKELTYVGDG